MRQRIHHANLSLSRFCRCEPTKDSGKVTGSLKLCVVRHNLGRCCADYYYYYYLLLILTLLGAMEGLSALRKYAGCMMSIRVIDFLRWNFSLATYSYT